MNETLTVSRWYRNFVSAYCLAFCGLLSFLLWLRLAAAGALGAQFLLAFTIGYALIVALLGIHLLFCWRHQLQIDNVRTASRGLWGLSEICLTDVTDVAWQADGPGVVVLRTNFDKLKILFVRYPPDESLRIIQYLRGAVPKSTQRDWDRFCLRVALPLRNPGTDTQRLEVLFSRAQFDRLLASIALAAFAYCAGQWWLVGLAGNWQETAVPLALIGLFWISVRWLVPVRYMTKIGWFPLAHFVNVLVDHCIWCSYFVVLIVLCVVFIFRAPRGLGLDLSIAVLVSAGAIKIVRLWTKTWKQYREERELDLQYSETAIREWEALDYKESAGI
jgi:hypothetical protein